jgi:hypothetical protein
VFLLQTKNRSHPTNETVAWLAKNHRETKLLRGLSVADPGVPWTEC